MKIGIDCRFFNSNFTGIGRYTHELIKNFIRINDETGGKHEFVLFFNNPEYNTYSTQNPKVKKVLAAAPHYSLKEQTHFRRILNKENCDIVHFPHFNVPILYRKPYIVTIHDLTLSFFPGQKMNRFYHRLAYNFTIKNATRTAKKVITVSENTKNDLVTHLKIPSSKIQVIHNGVSPSFTLLQDTDAPQKTLRKYRIKPPFLLYTGVWRNHKNLTRLVHAFNILKNMKNLDLQLVITGKPDPHYPEVTQTIKALNLTQDVILPGHVSETELVHLYNAAQIYVFPSLYEGFGLPPLESMKCGTPVAASLTSSIPEVCGPDNAVYFDPYSIEDIAEKIEMLYKDTDLQAKLIEKGFAHASKFSWKKSANETFKIITENV